MDTTLKGTMEGTTSYSKKTYDPKRRKVIFDMLSAGEDPNFVRFNHVRHGYDEDEVNDAINTFQRLTTGAKQTSPAAVSVDGRTYEIENLTQEKDYQDMKAKKAEEQSLKTTAEEDLTSKLTRLNEAINDNQGLKMAVGSSVLGRGVKVGNIYTEPNRSRFLGTVNQIINTDALDTLIQAKAKGATFGALSDTEMAILKSAATKLGSWQITDKKGNIIGYNVSEEDFKTELNNLKTLTEKAVEKLKTPEESTQIAETMTEDDQAYEWLQANPEHPEAERIRGVLEKKGYTKPEATPLPEQSPTLPEKPAIGESGGEKKPLANKIGEFLGMSKFGKGIGTAMFLKTKEGKKLQDDAAKGDKSAIEALQQILDEAPNTKELLGSAALTVLNTASGGTIKALQGATAAGKIGIGAMTGGAFGMAGGMEQDKDIKGIAKSTAVGAGVGGALSGLGVGYQKWREAKKAVRSDKVSKAVGQIVQGKKKDIPKALETLKRIDAKGVKTYEDLISRVDDNMAALGDSMDELLKQDKTAYKIDNLASSIKVGDKTVKSNYIKQALNNLDELYGKANDPGNAERIKQLSERAMSKGLSLQEINNIAKEYGMVFGKKAFTKLGEPTTSVSGMAYENTRKGVKDTLRNLLPDDKSKQIDKAFHENIKTSELLEKVDEKVNNLMQKVDERGLFEKGGRTLGKIAEKVPVVGGGAKGFLQAFIPSNAGNKTMNSLALQEALKKNLKIIENNGEVISQRIADRLSTGGTISQAFIQNLLRELQD